jgi:hypothetical protein
MFGIFKRKNSENTCVKRVVTQEEQIAINAYREQIRQENRKLVNKCIAEYIEKLKNEFILETPQPFTVGQMVTYDYYRIKPYNSLGWYSSLHQAATQFKSIEAFKGTFTAPVFKVYVDTSYLSDVLEKVTDSLDMYKPLNEDEVNRRIASKYLDRRSQRNHPLLEWIVDFDWATLRLPYDGSEEGWLNLRWGGFIADCFLPTNSKVAHRQIKMWNKERRYLKEKAKFERRKEEMEAEINKMKLKLDYEIKLMKGA